MPEITNLELGIQFCKYRILRLVGQAGVADRYEAEDTRIGRTIGLKVFPKVFERDE